MNTATLLRRIERAAEKKQTASDEFEQALRAANDGGLSLRTIAATANLSVEWTRKLIMRAAA